MKKFSVHPKRSWLYTAALGVFLFASCSDDSYDDNTYVNPEDDQSVVYDQSMLTLVPRDGEPILIDDLTPTDIRIAESRANNAAGNDRGRFNISLKYIFPPTPRQEQVFNDAAARWERIIIGDVPSFTGTLPSAFLGFPPAVDGTIDDIVIEVALVPLDGPGNVLGQAGPNFVRLDDFLTITGFMLFDTADLDSLDALDLFEEVIVHEMGHVLGVGTLWNINAPEFEFERNLLQGPLSNPYFAGRKANVFWNAEGGTGELPIESDFGPGTAFGHWDEATLNNELMTGFLNLGENPLSRITAGSMRDLGYRSSSVGEQYDLPKGTPGVDLSELETTDTSEGLNIAAREVIFQPVGFVSSSKKK